MKLGLIRTVLIAFQQVLSNSQNKVLIVGRTMYRVSPNMVDIYK